MYFNSCLAYTYAKNAWNLVEYPILVFAKSVMMIYTQDFLFHPTFSLTRFQNLCQWMNWTGTHFETGSSDCPLSSGLVIASYSFLLAAGRSYPYCQKIEKVRANTNTRFGHRWPTTFHLLVNTVLSFHLIHSRACPSCSVSFLDMNSSGTQEHDTAEEEEFSCFSVVSRNVWINAAIDRVTKKRTHN